MRVEYAWPIVTLFALLAVGEGCKRRPEPDARRDPVETAMHDVAPSVSVSGYAAAFSWRAAIEFRVTADDLLTCVEERDVGCFRHDLTGTAIVDLDSLLRAAGPSDDAGSIHGIRAIFVFRFPGRQVIWGLDYSCETIVAPAEGRRAIDCDLRRKLLAVLPEKVRSTALTVSTCRCDGG